MKRTKYTLTVLFNLINFFSFAQGEYIVEINRTNGNFNKITSAIPGITWVYPNIRAYNETNRTFIFQGGLMGPDKLYSIDVTNGSVISNPPFTGVDGKEFEFDNSTGTLYGLFFDTGLSQYFLQTINPTTGAHVNVSTSSIPNMGICQGFSTFDEINNKYLIIGNNNILSIDASTGIISSDTALGLLPGEVLVCASLSYDNSTGILYGLLWDQNITNKYFLVSINPSTGAVTKIGSGTTLLEQGGSSAIDKVNQQYMYLYGSVSAGGWEIATIDIATGNVVYNALVAPFNANDNFYSLEYDNIQGKLYSIHWETNCNTPIVNLGNDTTVCDNVQLYAGNCCTATYMWSTSETTQTIYTSSTGTYWVDVTDGCTTRDSIVVTVNTSPTVNLGNDTTVCDSILLDAGNPGASYLWSTSETTQTIYASSTGTYWVEVTAVPCPAVRDTIVVTVNTSPTVNLGNDTTISKDQSVLLEIAGGIFISYNWIPSSTLNNSTIANPQATPQETTVYYVTVIDSNGCEATDSVIVKVMEEETGIFIPNAFYPNGTGPLDNKVLKVYGSGIESIGFFIYDRWGELVYETNSVNDAMNMGWNGKFNGKSLNPATFVYSLKVVFNNNNEYSETGNIALIR